MWGSPSSEIGQSICSWLIRLCRAIFLKLLGFCSCQSECKKPILIWYNSYKRTVIIRIHDCSCNHQQLAQIFKNLGTALDNLSSSIWKERNCSSNVISNHVSWLRCMCKYTMGPHEQIVETQLTKATCSSPLNSLLIPFFYMFYSLILFEPLYLESNISKRKNAIIYCPTIICIIAFIVNQLFYNS